MNCLQLRSLRKSTSIISRAMNGDGGSQFDRLRSFINRLSNEESSSQPSPSRPPVNTKQNAAYKRPRGVAGLPEQDWGSASDNDWDPMVGLSS